MAIKKIIPIALDLKRITAQPNRIPMLVEGDTGNELVVTLTNEGEAVDLTDCLVLVVFSKPDGTTAEQGSAEDDGSVTISGDSKNVVTIALKSGSYSHGKNNCELQLYSGTDNSMLVTTAQFNFDARVGIANAETVKSTSEYPILLKLIEEATRAATLATHAAQDANASADDARRATEHADDAAEFAEQAAENITRTYAITKNEWDSVASEEAFPTVKNTWVKLLENHPFHQNDFLFYESGWAGIVKNGALIGENGMLVVGLGLKLTDGTGSGASKEYVDTAISAAIGNADALLGTGVIE